MDPYRTELLYPLIVAERVRDAQRAHLLVALRDRPGPGSRRAGWLGHLLVRSGRRLERSATLPAGAAAWLADPCGGCAD